MIKKTLLFFRELFLCNLMFINNKLNLRKIEKKNKSFIKSLLADNKPIRIELGSTTPRDGWVTVDLGPADIILDLSNKLPFPDNSIDDIYSSHLLEHLSYERLISLLSECLRVLKKNGNFIACVPDASIYIKLYKNLKKSDIKKYIRYEPAFHYHSNIDFINYIAYMDGHHNFMFDKKNILSILKFAGFNHVTERSFDKNLDSVHRYYESIYISAVKN